MAKNIRYQRPSNLVLPLAVASGTESGDVVAVGSAGLTGLALTDRATTATIADGDAAPGLADGEASVELPGIATAVELTIDAAGAAALGAKIYVTSGGVYTITATANTFIGYALEAISASGSGLVGLAGAGS